MHVLELHVEFHDHSVVNISTIVCDNPLEDAIQRYKVVLNESDDQILSNKGK